MTNPLMGPIKRALRAFGLQTSQTQQHPHSGSITHAYAEQVLARLDDPFRSALLSMYDGDPQNGIDGQVHCLDNTTRIPPDQGMWIYDLCLATKPKSTLEIGMAYGFSSLFFLAAIAKNQQGEHTTIDPFQKSYWHGIGLNQAIEHSPTLADRSTFRFIEDRSDRAATDLAREKQSFDIVFVDGNHRYDDILVDFYLYAQLTNVGGHIIFDDLWMNSVKTAVEFIRTNRRDFREVISSQANVRVFQKIGEDKRKWHEFSAFKVFSPTGSTK